MAEQDGLPTDEELEQILDIQFNSFNIEIQISDLSVFGVSFSSLHLQCRGSPRCGCVWIGILLAGQCIISNESVQRRGCYMDVVSFKKCLKTCLKGPIIFRVSFSDPSIQKKAAAVITTRFYHMCPFTSYSGHQCCVDAAHASRHHSGIG